MENKKATTLTVIVIVTAMVVITIAIAWLSANPQSMGCLGYNYDNNYAPGYYPGETDPPAPGNIPGHATYGTPRDEEGYPAPPPYNYEQYPAYNYEGYPPIYDGGDYPYYGTEESDYIFNPVFTSEPLSEDIIRMITGVTFHDTTPFGFDYLAYLTVTHVNFDGESTQGHLIVAADIAYEVLAIFREIYEGGFPIHSIKVIDYFDANDYLSMAANNSHAFNFRFIAGTNIISRHGFGRAIDINPVQNPYIRGETIWPAAGAEYLDRSYVRPGMIVPGDVVYTAFTSRGWIWGGHWTLPRDYHHFERRR